MITEVIAARGRMFRLEFVPDFARVSNMWVVTAPGIEERIGFPYKGCAVAWIEREHCDLCGISAGE